MKVKQTVNKLLESNLGRFLFFGGLIAGFIFIMLFVVSSVWIGYVVKTECQLAQKQYKQTECVQALITKIQDEEISLSERNSVTWALGQLGDPAALGVLESLYTGADCDHDKYLCQYELKKAINLLKKGFNLTNLVRRD